MSTTLSCAASADTQQQKLKYESLLLLQRHESMGKEAAVSALHHLESTLKRNGFSGQRVHLHKNGKSNGFIDGTTKSLKTDNVFLKQLGAEVLTAHCTASLHAEKLWQDMISILDSLPSKNKQTRFGQHELSMTWQECNLVGQRLVDLEALVKENVAMFAGMAKDWDVKHGFLKEASQQSRTACLGYEQDSDYNGSVQKCILQDSYLEPCMIVLSDIYERLRGLQNGEKHCNGIEPAWQPPSRFTRDTTKYWMKPEDVLLFKCEVIKHLPLMIFDRKTSFQPGSRLGSLESQQPLLGWTTVSSVYFDSEDMDSYVSRLQREDRAAATRIRFYGHRSRSGSQEVFLERKVHREPWTGEQSCKERCALRQEDVYPLLNGTDLPNYIAPETSSHTFAQDVQSDILAANQGAVLRTVCNRTAFQERSSDLVRISLDAQLQMIGELCASRASGDWCRDERTPLLPDQVIDFPYCVVEIKLRTEEPPSWISNLVASGMLLQAPRFSKYLHGVAALFPERVSKMPYWFLHNTDGSMTSATWEEMSDDKDTYYEENAAPWMFPKPNEAPLLSKLQKALRRPGQKGVTEAGANVSLEGMPLQNNEGLQAMRHTLAREEMPATDNSNQPSFPPPVNSTLAGLGSLEQTNGSAAGSTSKDQSANASPEDMRLPTEIQDTLHASERSSMGDILSTQFMSDPAMIDPGKAADLPGEATYNLPAPPIPLEVREIAHHVPQLESQAPTQPKANGLTVSKRPASTLSVFQSKTGDVGRRVGKVEAPGPKPLQTSYRSKALVRSRVEPKTFFANERTFLAWLNISVLIMLTGLSLLGGSFASFGGSSGCSGTVNAPASSGGLPTAAAASPSSFNCRASQYAGLAISPVAVLFMIYALFMYKMRTIQILQQRKSVRYDDQRGPILLVVLLVGALLTAMVFTAQAAFSS